MQRRWQGDARPAWAAWCASWRPAVSPAPVAARGGSGGVSWQCHWREAARPAVAAAGLAEARPASPTRAPSNWGNDLLAGGVLGQMTTPNTSLRASPSGDRDRRQSVSVDHRLTAHARHRDRTRTRSSRCTMQRRFSTGVLFVGATRGLVRRLHAARVFDAGSHVIRQPTLRRGRSQVSTGTCLNAGEDGYLLDVQLESPTAATSLPVHDSPGGDCDQRRRCRCRPSRLCLTGCT